MRKMLLSAVILAAGVGALCPPNARAVPANAPAVRKAASAASVMQQVQYVERHTRYGAVKCYREFVVGPYYCHWFPYPHWYPYPY
jgi:hypothetical protein